MARCNGTPLCKRFTLQQELVEASNSRGEGGDRYASTPLCFVRD
jgi:hypothetical protein